MPPLRAPASKPPGASARGLRARELLWIPALCLLVYGNSLSNGYSIDDYLVVEGHPQTQRGIAAIPEILTTNFMYQDDSGASYRAIPRISFALEYELFGANPAVSHLLNLILHAGVGVAILLLLRLLFPAAHPWIPWLAALLFVAHPVHSEVVNNLKNRDELMASLFGFLSLYGFLHYQRSGASRFFVLGVGCFLASLLSKESGLQFIAALPVVLFFSGEAAPRRSLLCLAGAAAAVAACWLYMLLALDTDHALYMASWSEAFNFVEHPLIFVQDASLRYGTALYSLGYYLRLILFPHPLSFFYGYGAIPLVGLGDGRVILSVAAYLGIVAVALVGLRRRTVPAFASLFFLGTLAAFSNLLVPMQGIVAERHVYAASLGFCILLAWLLGRLAAWPAHEGLGRGLAAGALALVLGVYAAKNLDRNRDWRDHFEIAQTDARSFPDSAIIRTMLFKLHRERGWAIADPEGRRREIEAGLEHLLEVARIWPPYTARVSYLVGLLRISDLNQSREAIAHLQDARRAVGRSTPSFDPEQQLEAWKVELKLAEAHLRLGEMESAARWLEQSIADYERSSERPFPRRRLEGLTMGESLRLATTLMDPP